MIKNPQSRILELTEEIQHILKHNLPSGQTVIRPIRPQYPLSSQLIQDALDELKTDLQAILNNSNLQLEELIFNTHSAIVQIENILREKALNLRQTQEPLLTDDHTTDWRQL